MEIPRNQFKAALNNKQVQIGLFSGLANSLTTEIIAGCGFDFLVLDAEHGPNDLRTILAQLQAAAAYPVNLLVRPPSHDAAFIKQLLAMGVQSLIIPMVSSAEEAAAMVASVRYPPAGFRGVGTAIERGARWNGVDNYLTKADSEMCLIIQVESQAGLDALDDILTIDGVDGVFIGPADLAASMGYLGNAGHPEVKTAIGQALSTISAAGKAGGIFSSDAAAVKQYQAMGARIIAVGVDTLLLRTAAMSLASKFK